MAEDFELTGDLHDNLLAAGWKYFTGTPFTFSDLADEKCRICRQIITPWDDCWQSPKYTHYHESCLGQSPMALRDMKKSRHERWAEEE